MALAKFVRFTDFAPCDFNGDGTLDVLAFSSRLSTAYGYVGFGNGKFGEGPVFDLPFRPAAVAVAAAGTREQQVLLVGADGVVLPFNPLASLACDPSSGAGEFAAYCVDSGQGAAIAVCDYAKLSCTLYTIVPGGVKRLESMPVQNSTTPGEWCRRLASWSGMEAPAVFPVPPAGSERTMLVEDLDGDGTEDLLWLESGRVRIAYMGTQAKEVQFECSPAPDVIRIGDVNDDGLVDILALTTSAATLQVFIGRP